MADSLSLRTFLDLDVTDAAPDHSTLSRTRRLIDEETHAEVFTWVLSRVADAGLVRGKTIGIDATTLEANAAMRSIERRDTGESYEAFVRRLAEASGIETPTRAELARFDRSRKDRKTSNKEWRTDRASDRPLGASDARLGVQMDTGGVRRLNRSSLTCLNRPARRTDFFHGLLRVAHLELGEVASVGLKKAGIANQAVAMRHRGRRRAGARPSWLPVRLTAL